MDCGWCMECSNYHVRLQSQLSHHFSVWLMWLPKTYLHFVFWHENYRLPPLCVAGFYPTLTIRPLTLRTWWTEAVRRMDPHASGQDAHLSPGPPFQWLSFAYQGLTEIPYDTILKQTDSLEVLDLSFNLLEEYPSLWGVVFVSSCWTGSQTCF